MHRLSKDVQAKLGRHQIMGNEKPYSMQKRVRTLESSAFLSPYLITSFMQVQLGLASLTLLKYSKSFLTIYFKILLRTYMTHFPSG